MGVPNGRPPSRLRGIQPPARAPALSVPPVPATYIEERLLGSPRISFLSLPPGSPYRVVKGPDHPTRF